MSARKSLPSTARDTAPTGRFGHLDTQSGRWVGRPEELGSDEIVLDRDAPHDRTRVQRVRSGVLSLHQDGKISDAEAVAADRWHRDWSLGTGHPMRASEMRFLGVSLGGAESSDGIPTRQIDAATRHREAASAVGLRASERLTLFVCLGRSLRAASILVGTRAADMTGLLVGDLQRLAEHYQAADAVRDAAERRRAGGKAARAACGASANG